MDTITHITLGACVGEIFLGKTLGKKALFWGALSQCLPDVDTISGVLLPADRAFLIHRGITHSIFFAIIVGFILAFAIKTFYRKTRLPFSLLAFFFCFQLLLHDLLDTCNSYGTGLLEPFSHQRFSINLLYVVDPFFTISLLIATLFLIFKSSNYINRPKWALIAIGISAFYLVMAGINKTYINHRAEISFQSQKIKQSDYFSTPAPFNCMLWYIVAVADSNYYTAYSSFFDDAKNFINYEAYRSNHNLLINSLDKNVFRNLVTFADNYYTVTQSSNILYLNVLRFEQVEGWRQKNAPFTFSYPLSAGHNRVLLLQRGRLEGWDINTFKDYVRRIAGQAHK